jgi:hypothetical protein
MHSCMQAGWVDVHIMPHTMKGYTGNNARSLMPYIAPAWTCICQSAPVQAHSSSILPGHTAAPGARTPTYKQSQAKAHPRHLPVHSVQQAVEEVDAAHCEGAVQHHTGDQGALVGVLLTCKERGGGAGAREAGEWADTGSVSRNKTARVAAHWLACNCVPTCLPLPVCPWHKRGDARTHGMRWQVFGVHACTSKLRPNQMCRCPAAHMHAHVRRGCVRPPPAGVAPPGMRPMRRTARGSRGRPPCPPPELRT